MGTKPNQVSNTSASAAIETSIDVEWAHVIAPAANIMLVEATSDTLTSLMSAVNWATSNGATVVSMSWGSSEFSSETTYDSQYFVPQNNLGQGITYVASSGDSGGSIEWPAVSPNVLGVGGTSIGLDAYGFPSGGQTAWDDLNYNPPDGASSGGISLYEKQPSYQNGLTISDGTTTISSNGMRVGPDVSFDADPYTGVPIYDSTPYSYREYGYYGHKITIQYWSQYGGTSIAAPEVAALIAIADQGILVEDPTATTFSSAQTSNGPNTLTAIYGLPSSDFYDVTMLSNENYSAGPGFDLVTGRGTPLANTFVPDLVNYGVTYVMPGDASPGAAPVQPNANAGDAQDTQVFSLLLSQGQPPTSLPQAADPTDTAPAANPISGSSQTFVRFLFSAALPHAFAIGSESVLAVAADPAGNPEPFARPSVLTGTDSYFSAWRDRQTEWSAGMRQGLADAYQAPLASSELIDKGLSVTAGHSLPTGTASDECSAACNADSPGLSAWPNRFGAPANIWGAALLGSAAWYLAMYWQQEGRSLVRESRPRLPD